MIVRRGSKGSIGLCFRQVVIVNRCMSARGARISKHSLLCICAWRLEGRRPPHERLAPSLLRGLTLPMPTAAASIEARRGTCLCTPLDVVQPSCNFSAMAWPALTSIALLILQRGVRVIKNTHPPVTRARDILTVCRASTNRCTLFDNCKPPSRPFFSKEKFGIPT